MRLSDLRDLFNSHALLLPKGAILHRRQFAVHTGPLTRSISYMTYFTRIAEIQPLCGLKLCRLTGDETEFYKVRR